MVAAAQRNDQRFPKSDRVVKQTDFDRVHASRAFAADQYLVLKGVPNQRAFSRLGLSISRRVGNAVVRNRWKRTLREAFRRHRAQLPSGWDWVVRPRKDAVLDPQMIARSMIHLACRMERQLQRQSTERCP